MVHAMAMRPPTTPKLMIIKMVMFPDMVLLPSLEYLSGNGFGPVLYVIFLI